MADVATPSGLKGAGGVGQDGFATAGSIVINLSEGDTTSKSSDKEFVEFVAAAPDGITRTFALKFGPTDATFDYPGGTYDAGERPIDPIQLLLITDDQGHDIGTLSGIAQLNITVQQLVAITTTAALEALLLSGDDQLFFAEGADTIRALPGNDKVFAGAGNDTVYGGLGNDSLNGEIGNDMLFGDDGLDTLFGGDGNDTEDGGAGNDLLGGGNSNDILKGGAGNDRIIGGFGKDTLTGGAGKDVFAYQTLSKFNGQESGLKTSTRDTITDFKHGQDKIDPSFILIPKFKFLGDAPLTGLGQIHYKYVGKDTVVEISTDKDAGAELSILLKGHITLTKGDFVL
jgi:Ca2+-binding RTX toxin-like protein